MSTPENTAGESNLHRRLRWSCRRLLIRIKARPLNSIITAIVAMAVLIVIAAIFFLTLTAHNHAGDNGRSAASRTSTSVVESVTPVNVTKAPGSTPGAHGVASMEGVSVKRCEADHGRVAIEGSVHNAGERDLTYRNWVTVKTDKGWYRVQIDTGTVKAGGRKAMSKTLDRTPVEGAVSSCAVYTETQAG